MWANPLHSVILTEVPAQSKDWVGIYAQGITPEDAICPSWKYVGKNTTTKIDLNVADARNYNGPLQEGCYFANYFKNDGYDEAYDRIYFVIGKPCRISQRTISTEEGEKMEFTWDGLPMNAQCMIVRKEAGDPAYIAWKGIEPIIGVSGTITTTNLPKGEHEVCIWYEDKVISNTINISVKNELSIGKAKADAAKGEAYTLDGKKLTGHTSKGIFIRDGRKYMRH